MSGSTGDSGEQPLTGAEITELRDWFYRSLRRSTTAQQLAAFKHTPEEQLGPELLCCSIILEHAIEFDPEVIRRAAEFLEQNGFSALPGAELPAWVYVDSAKRVAAATSDDGSGRYAAQIEAVNDPQWRKRCLELALETADDDVFKTLTSEIWAHPFAALLLASVVNEHADRFPTRVAQAARWLLGPDMFGQNLGPGAPIVANPQLVAKVVEGEAWAQVVPIATAMLSFFDDPGGLGGTMKNQSPN